MGRAAAFNALYGASIENTTGTVYDAGNQNGFAQPKHKM